MASYWERRKAREAFLMYEDVEAKAEELARVYAEASEDISSQVRRLRRKFQLKNNLSRREADRLLNTLIEPNEIRLLTDALKRDPKNREIGLELESQAYTARIQRLNKLQAGIDVTVGQIAVASNLAITAELKRVAEYAYYHEVFAMQQQADAAYFFNPMTPERIAAIMDRRWSGESYSQRVWDNTAELAQDVKREILKGMLTGASTARMARSIEDRFHEGATNARRLMRTEANYVANQVTLEAYREAGVEKYIYVAVLDLRTSEVCRSLDKKRFLVRNAKVGENYPPMHPWCRSTTIAWMPDDLLRALQQTAIDPATGKRIKVPMTWSWDKWYKEIVMPKEGQNG